MDHDVEPAQWEKVGKDWNKFAQTPSGTGTWKVTAFQPQTRAELSPNKEYRDKARVPKLDRMVLLPIPEPATRTAALRSGQVDWIEAPSPDAIPSLEKAGFKLISNAYPHNWTWHLSFADNSPWKDVRVRKAANLAVDREGLKVLLKGMMIPAKGLPHAGQPVVRQPELRREVRSRGGEEAAGRGGLQQGQAGDGQGADLELRLGPDAAAADERVHPAEPGRRRHQDRVRGRRVEHADQPVAGWRKVGPGQGRQRAELQLLHPGPVHRLHPSSRFQAGGAQRHQLGFLPGPRHGRAAGESAHHLRPEGAGRGAEEGPREDRRRRAVPVRDPRRGAARFVDQGHGLHPGAELVPGLLADHDEVDGRRGGVRRPVFRF
ncbi:MAG: hypothetical protein KA171_01460 [Reyranella sp.]|nr:hypothetical protein [Reyranella sp.]